MRLTKVIMNNVAPVGNLTLDLGNENITVLSGINGKGKTTILSYIVDSFYELAKQAFHNEFESKQNKFYRVSSILFSIDMSKPSIVYLRFIDNDGCTNIDYVDIRQQQEQLSEEYYLSVIQLDDHIPFSNLTRTLNDNSSVKYWSLTKSKDIQDIFNHSVLTYFPAYRYETPYYLNDPYKVELNFRTNMDFEGYLDNPIEVTSELQQIANWCMDIVLDIRGDEPSAKAIFQQVNTLLSNILHNKFDFPVRLGIGNRNQGAIRLAVTENNGYPVYPSIFCMSSGELALLCLFGEILRQSDKIGTTSENIHGIVLVDEIDKHLHITLQKEVLPKLISMFPNIQFIVSSHSPFLGLGLEEQQNLAYKIFDLDNGGIPCPPNDNEIFKDAYDTFIHEREKFSELNRQLQAQLSKASRTVIITEGKTDWKHLKAAMKALSITDLDIDFYEYDETFGDSQLITMLQNFARVPNPRKIIGIFDRDNLASLKIVGKDNSQNLADNKYICLGNNVYAFAIPAVHTDIYGTSYISIEHYYLKEHLLRPDDKGRRLFLGSEFYETGTLKKNTAYRTRDNIRNKVKINGIIDQKVFDTSSDPEETHSLALSKNKFARNILDGNAFAQSFDFSAFTAIFDIIREICGQA